MNLHGNHLHVTALETAMQLVLVGVNEADILFCNRELLPARVLSQRVRLAVMPASLLRVHRISGFEASSTICHVTRELPSKRKWRNEEKMGQERSANEGGEYHGVINTYSTPPRRGLGVPRL